MPDQLGRLRSNLRSVTRTLELRNRVRRASIVIENTGSRAADRGDRFLWQTYKHYFWAIGGALVGGAFVLVATALLDGSRTANRGESAKITNPMIVAVDRALAKADQLVKILETIVGQGQSKALLEGPGGKGEYKECLENCVKSIRIDDESDKWLLINCRNECISQYSKRVQDIRKLYKDSN